MDKIEILMDEIVGMEKPSVYNVSLTKKDWSSLWIAFATLRADGRNFSVEHESPVIALCELHNVLMSLMCPTCHQLKLETEGIKGE